MPRLETEARREAETDVPVLRPLCAARSSLHATLVPHSAALGRTGMHLGPANCALRQVVSVACGGGFCAVLTARGELLASGSVGMRQLLL